MNPANSIFEAYDLPTRHLVSFYQRLNTPIPYPNGMQVTLDTLYWGREVHYPALLMALSVLELRGIEKLSQLHKAIRTPGKMKKFAAESGITVDILRILKHDLGLWLPQPVPLSVIKPLEKYSPAIQALAQVSISNQLQLLSQAQTRPMRSSLAQKANIDLEILNEVTRLCDMYRTGRNLAHIRDQIYYDMGLNTWQKWTESSSEAIIARFSEYILQHNLEAVRLLPWPREVRNGIEWARLHLSIFAVEW
jgi:hypothetical protein